MNFEKKAARSAAEDARAVAKASGDAWQRLQFDALDVGHVGGSCIQIYPRNTALVTWHDNYNICMYIYIFSTWHNVAWAAAKRCILWHVTTSRSLGRWNPHSSVRSYYGPAWQNRFSSQQTHPQRVAVGSYKNHAQVQRIAPVGTLWGRS